MSNCTLSVNIGLKYIIYADVQQQQQSSAVVLPQNIICCGESTAPHGVRPIVDESATRQASHQEMDVTGPSISLPMVKEIEDEYGEKSGICTSFSHIKNCR